jgi:hypothetical protein
MDAMDSNAILALWLVVSSIKIAFRVNTGTILLVTLHKLKASLFSAEHDTIKFTRDHLV